MLWHICLSADPVPLIDLPSICYFRSAVMDNRPTILIFARSAAVEAQTKWSHLPKRAATQLSAHLLQATIRTVEASGYNFLIIDESLQHGTHFGARITAAIATVRSIHGSLIIIGGDCPGLTTDTLHNAADSLKQCGLVLGPDRSGGVYLIGLDKATYASIDWSIVQWQTSSVYRDLADQHDHAVLQVLTDIHTVDDVRQASFYDEVSSQLAATILSLLVVLTPHLRIVHNLVGMESGAGIQQRGPPAAAA